MPAQEDVIVKPTSYNRKRFPITIVALSYLGAFFWHSWMNRRGGVASHLAQMDCITTTWTQRNHNGAQATVRWTRRMEPNVTQLYANLLSGQSFYLALYYSLSQINLFFLSFPVIFCLVHFFLIGQTLWACLSLGLILPGSVVQVLSFRWFMSDAKKGRTLMILIHVLHMGIYIR